MKKVSAVLAVVVLVVSLVSLAFAGTKMGTVKSVDAKAGTIVLTMDGKDETLKADKSVDLSKCKAGDKVEVSVEKDVVKSIKAAAAKPKAAVGC
jgi:hypothetical protein